MGKTVNSARNVLCGGSFVEDRLATLQNVVKDPELDQWNLYLGTRFSLTLCPTDGKFGSESYLQQELMKKKWLALIQH
jgi:hypothetical protein